jgi:hypothetical protein
MSGLTMTSPRDADRDSGTERPMRAARPLGTELPRGSTLYSRALLRYDDRVALEGATTEPVEAKVKDMAAEPLAQLSARNAT